MMPNLCAILDFGAPYHAINREERNLAALLYHALLLPGNLERFLRVIECPFALREDEAAVYFEYALLRDLWHTEVRGNEAAARRVIEECLAPPPEVGLGAMSIEELNRFFGTTSSKYIRNPGTWSGRRFMREIADDAFFLSVCRFKWCFNTKPDLVIQLGPDEVVCIEAKLESAEGSYPTHPKEKREFARRGLTRVGQMELQRHLFEELLGMKTQLVFLVADGAKGSSSTHERLTWREAFDAMDLTGAPTWVHAWVARV
jgi:hypothetical protein